MFQGYILPSSSFIALLMEVVRTSEMSVWFDGTTWRYMSESCHLHARCHDNLKSHLFLFIPHAMKFLMSKQYPSKQEEALSLMVMYF
jgi:hypothetical protein